MSITRGLGVLSVGLLASWLTLLATAAEPAKPAATGAGHDHSRPGLVKFDLRSVQDGNWSNPKTWNLDRVPKAGDRVLVERKTRVVYDVKSVDVLRLVQVVGTLSFARDRDTELNVAVFKVQNSDECSESGFACDFADVNQAGEPQGAREGNMPLLEVGSIDQPIPAAHTAKIRLHFLDGMNKEDAPALVCCSARMELHGAPLNRTWVKLGEDAKAGGSTIVVADDVVGWKVGDEVVVTGAKKLYRRGTARGAVDASGSEPRKIAKIDGRTIHLDEPLELDHFGSGEFRSELANLSRNVIVESADPKGVRGHTMYHAYSRGGISYARFAHLGKEGVLGRYAIHYHLVGDTMRGSQVLGAAIVDSHNRWITIHGTQYLVVRDCVGYQSVGHGYFMEDGTEIYNLLDRNLGVQAYRAKRLPKQVLPFDPNDGAAFWWSNGRNTLVRNVACENDEYGFRYDMQHNSAFNSTLPILMPDGTTKEVDVRTIGIWRFEDNETHSEGLYGLVVAANGNSQPDTGIRDQKTLDQITRVDWTGPDARHPHIIRNLKIWEAHYAFRPHSPSMLIENVRIHRVAYGIYRPTFDNQVFRNLHLSNAGGEPFNRGMDDASAQAGSITVDGLRIDDWSGGNQRHPVVHMSDNNLSGKASSHFRNVRWSKDDGRRPVFNRGGSQRVDPFVAQSVPYFVHDYYGPGEHAKIVSTKAYDLLVDGNKYQQEPPLTGDESVVTKVRDVAWPKLLDPIDDVPPATVMTHVKRNGDQLTITGITHDNGEITSITVNGQPAKVTATSAGVVDWSIELPLPKDGKLVALATDAAGNREQTPHRRKVD